MPTGLYTRYEYENKTQRFTPRQNQSRSLKNKALSYFLRIRPHYKIESDATTSQ